MFDLAIYYRMVGGFVGTGSTFLARLRWSLTIAAYMTFAAYVHYTHNQPALYLAYIFVLVTLGAFIGRLIPHARFQATASIGNSLGMAAVNLARLALIVVPYAWWFDYRRFTLIAFGALAGIAYYVGNKYLAGKDCGIYFRNQHTQWHIDAIPVPSDTQLVVTLPNTVIADNLLDRCATGGSEWGELLTGMLVYELMFIIALALPW